MHVFTHLLILALYFSLSCTAAVCVHIIAMYIAQRSSLNVCINVLRNWYRQPTVN